MRGMMYAMRLGLEVGAVRFADIKVRRNSVDTDDTS